MFGDPGDVRRYWEKKRAGGTEQQALEVGDPGIGSPYLGTINTTQVYGVAVPEDYLRKTFGDDPSNWRKARVQLRIGDRTITVPIVDVGPGKGQRAKGVVSDLTHLLDQALGTEGMGQVNIRLLPNAGPDYSTDRANWDAEQKQIASAFANPLALGSPNPTPYAEGGIVTEPTIALVGEKGPEAIVPLSTGGFSGISNMMGPESDPGAIWRVPGVSSSTQYPRLWSRETGWQAPLPISTEPEESGTQLFWRQSFTEAPMSPGQEPPGYGPPDIAPGTKDPLILERMAQPETNVPQIPGTQDVPEMRPWGPRRPDKPGAPPRRDYASVNPDEHPIHQDMDALSNWLATATFP
jgi:hypothetical protein